MSRPRKLTPQALALFEHEARRRAQALSNKSLALRFGLSPGYVANIIARMRREIEHECQHDHVSCETDDE